MFNRFHIPVKRWFRISNLCTYTVFHFIVVFHFTLNKKHIPLITLSSCRYNFAFVSLCVRACWCLQICIFVCIYDLEVRSNCPQGFLQLCTQGSLLIRFSGPYVVPDSKAECSVCKPIVLAAILFLHSPKSLSFF